MEKSISHQAMLTNLSFPGELTKEPQCKAMQMMQPNCRGAPPYQGPSTIPDHGGQNGGGGKEDTKGQGS